MPGSTAFRFCNRTSKENHEISNNFLKTIAYINRIFRYDGNTHCVISLLIPLEEDVCEFLIFSYSFKGQQLLLKQSCSNRLSFQDSLLTSTAGAACLGRIGCAG